MYDGREKTGAHHVRVETLRPQIDHDETKGSRKAINLHLDRQTRKSVVEEGRKSLVWLGRERKFSQSFDGPLRTWFPAVIQDLLSKLFPRSIYIS